MMLALSHIYSWHLQSGQAVLGLVILVCVLAIWAASDNS
jgi:hypothetical protein